MLNSKMAMKIVHGLKIFVDHTLKAFLTLKLTDVGIFYIQLNNIFAMTFIFYCFNSVDRYYRNSQLVRTGPVRHM